MYNIITGIFLLILSILGGIGVSIYSRHCELKYNLFEDELDHNNISKKRTLIITIILVLLSLINFLVYLKYESIPLNWITFFFSLIMVYMIVIDFETMYILDRTHIIIIALAILSFIFKATISKSTPLIDFKDGLFGLLAGGGTFFIIALIANPMAKRKYGDDVLALGYGDVKLMAACGLFLGWKLIIISIILGSLVGIISQIFIKIFKKNDEVNFAFGPYLAIGIILSLYFGNYLIELYLNILG